MSGVAVALPPSSIGVMTDLHGNTVALRSVIADAERRGVDRWLVLVSDDGRGVAPDLDATTVARLFPDHQADLILAGHTHKHTDLRIDGARFVNPGSVSNHDESHVPAQYSIVRVGREKHQVEHHDVAYDKAEAVAAIRESGIPGAGFLLTRYFGLDPGNGS